MYRALPPVKRVLDIFVSATALALLSPAILAVAFFIMAADGFPVIFRQERSGANGATFHILKFRTMAVAKGNDESSDSDRMTRWGSILRRSSLDELPSFWNVLIGQMSLVGPRPLPVEYETLYSPLEARRLSVKPGITGYAQVHGRNSLSWAQKFELDIWYVDNQSMLLDLRILAKTCCVVLSGTGVNAEGSATMPRFRGTKGRD
jgi:lipopolysaccharide/colanic/teichoic acid biosynthesis glycosyltransferase